MSDQDPQTSGLDERLRVSAEFSGLQPCSVLAEHVATATLALLAHKIPRVPENDVEGRFFMEAGGQVVRTVTEGDEDRATTYKFISVPLTHETRLDGGRRVHLELAVAGEQETYRRRFRTHTTTKLADTEQAHVLAVTRDGNAAAHILSIAYGRSDPDCTFVVFPHETEKLGEILVGSDEIHATPERERALHLFWQLIKKCRNGGVSRSWDAKGLGVGDRWDEVFGQPDSNLEQMLRIFDRIAKTNSVNIPRNLDLNGISYSGSLHVTAHENDKGEIITTCEFHLPGAPNFGSVPVFPQMRILPASRYPLRFGDIDPTSDQHHAMANDMYELLTQQELWRDME